MKNIPDNLAEGFRSVATQGEKGSESMLALKAAALSAVQQKEYIERKTLNGALERLRRSMPRFLQLLFWGY